MDSKTDVGQNLREFNAFVVGTGLEGRSAPARLACQTRQGDPKCTVRALLCLSVGLPGATVRSYTTTASIKQHSTQPTNNVISPLDATSNCRNRGPPRRIHPMRTPLQIMGLNRHHPGTMRSEEQAAERNPLLTSCAVWSTDHPLLLHHRKFCTTAA